MNGILSPEGIYYDCGEMTHHDLVLSLGLDWLQNDEGWIIIESGSPYLFDGCEKIKDEQLNWIYRNMKNLNSNDQQLIERKLKLHFEIWKKYESKIAT